MNIRSDKKLQFTVCFCGDAATGKTALVRACTGRAIVEGYEPTVMAQAITYELKQDSSEVMNITFWDLVGSENHRASAPQFFREAALNVIVFDLTRPSTFESIQGWAQLASDSSEVANVPLILVGNKCDLERAVQTSDAEAIRSQLNALAYLETSAKGHVQLGELCTLIAEQAKEFFNKSEEEIGGTVPVTRQFRD